LAASNSLFFTFGLLRMPELAMPRPRKIEKLPPEMLSANVKAAQQEFDMAITLHEVWKPMAYDQSLRERMGVSYATNAFRVIVGFSSLMERDEEGTYARVGRLRRELIEPRLSEHQGRLIKTTGDGFLAEFASPIAALRCAIAIQGDLSNDPGPLRMRIGLNLGEVIVEESGDVYGEGVNVAARLEALCEPGGILISGKIHSEVDGKVEAAFEDRGEQQVKNISRPVRIYAVRPVGLTKTSAATASSNDVKKPLQLPDKPSIAVLPFQNMSGDPDQEYFADGMVEDSLVIPLSIDFRCWHETDMAERPDDVCCSFAAFLTFLTALLPTSCVTAATPQARCERPADPRSQSLR
jgi:class 3 adenylate cyclase